jgi:hypothetical protein
VPGFRFSLLLTRSTQFGRFAELLYTTYQDPVDLALINSMIQLLWDRGEANGYAWHLARDPLPDTPRHTVLLHEAFGDHQSRTSPRRRRPISSARGSGGPPSIRGEPRSAAVYGSRAVPGYPWGGNPPVVYGMGRCGRRGAARPAPRRARGRRRRRSRTCRPRSGSTRTTAPASRCRRCSSSRPSWLPTGSSGHLQTDALLRGRVDWTVIG